jgi:hypothetical protein
MFAPALVRRNRIVAAVLFASHFLLLAQSLVAQEDSCEELVSASVTLDEGHPWLPPFGLERVGRPVAAVVQVESKQRPLRDYILAGFIDGKEVERHALNLVRGSPPYTAEVSFQNYPQELVLTAQCRFAGKPVELVRQQVDIPVFQADAIAKPDTVLHPVDLGTIFVPNDWLLLGPRQTTHLEVAAVSHKPAPTNAWLEAWFETQPAKKFKTAFRLEPGKKRVEKLALAAITPGAEKDLLHVRITQEGGQLWQKKIHTMFVPTPPTLPSFGATAMRLRYDGPISVRDATTGNLSEMDYDTAWAPHLTDVVVTLPNGSRFVFWRGSCYIPFWAGKHNNGLSYEWAETTPPPDGFKDSVEPLMDKELRYGRVEIVESTAARVHVRWSYQSTDFQYKVWGDHAVEDFYFYPDGYGTRVLTLTSAVGADYELSEFIVLTPRAAFPFDVLPRKLVDFIFIDGSKHEIEFPFRGPPSPELGFPGQKLTNPRKVPIVYRLRVHKDEEASVVYFNPNDTSAPFAFQGLRDRGRLVTPAYWGSHWPLARGATTGWSIDDRIYLTPAHNSTLTWGLSNRPVPLSSGEIQTIDTLGRSKTMSVQKWAWLIGMTTDNDVRLLEWARSFTRPPNISLTGATTDLESYSPERRAIRIRATDKLVTVTLKPVVPCVNPVFEIASAQGTLTRVIRDGRDLNARDYSWDGKTLWINETVRGDGQLQLEFR